MHCGLERDITISPGDIQFWICNCFVCEFDDFLLFFVSILVGLVEFSPVANYKSYPNLHGIKRGL